MIEKTYPSKKLPVQSVVTTLVKRFFTPADEAQARLRKISTEEYVRRDKIIRTEWNACPFKEGDIVYPKAQKDYMDYGPVKITGMLRSYKDTAIEDEWPKNDNPFILTIQPLKGKQDLVFCTANWVAKSNPHLLLENV